MEKSAGQGRQESHKIEDIQLPLSLSLSLLAIDEGDTLLLHSVFLGRGTGAVSSAAVSRRQATGGHEQPRR